MRLRYSFKTLLIAFTLLAVCIGTFGVRLHRANRQRDAVAELRAAGATVMYGYESSNGTPMMNVADPLGSPNLNAYSPEISRWKLWLGRRFGRDFVFDVGYVYKSSPISADLVRRVTDLRNLGHLQLDVRRPFDDDAWSALRECRQVEKLSLQRDQIGDARSLKGLAALKQLQALAVDGGEITVDDAREIAKLKDLRELDLGLVSVTDESLEPFGKLKKLESFKLTHRGTGRNEAAAGVAFVSHLRNLRSLELARLEMLDDEVFAKLESLKLLETLSLEGAKITGAELHRLTRLPKLKELNLTGVQLNEQALETIGKLTRLESLWMPYANLTDAGLEHIAAMPNLRMLSVSGNRITDAGVAEIARLPRLNVLSLVSCDVRDAGLKHLEKLSQLHSVWLSGNEHLSIQAIAQLRAAMPQCNVYEN
jgi:Leucine-rich repeat (LRR) protein